MMRFLISPFVYLLIIVFSIKGYSTTESVLESGSVATKSVLESGSAVVNRSVAESVFTTESDLEFGSATTKSADNYFSKMSGEFVTEYIRNIRINKKNFLQVKKKNNILDTLYIKNQVIFIYPISFSENNTFFTNTKSILSFSYQRYVYATPQEINSDCWYSYMCFQDIYLGLLKPIIVGERFSNFSGTFGMYLVFPFSRSSFNSSFIIGGGTYLKIKYQLFSNEFVKASLLFKKNIELNGYVYNTANKAQNIYNIPLSVSYKIRLGFTPLQYLFIPSLYFESTYEVSLDCNKDFFHDVGLTIFASWVVNKKIDINIGLFWEDKIFKPKNSKLVKKTIILNPDRTFLIVGGVYKF